MHSDQVPLRELRGLAPQSLRRKENLLGGSRGTF